MPIGRKDDPTYNPKYVLVPQLEKFDSIDDMNNWFVRYRAEYTEVKSIETFPSGACHVHLIRRFATTA